MNNHVGRYLQFELRRHKVSLSDLCEKLRISLQTLYGWFNQKNLSSEIVLIIGRTVGHDLIANSPLFEADDHTEPIVHLIEDKALDRDIFKFSIRSLVITDELEIFKNGDEAINNLLDLMINNPRNLPDYIFVDINMPVLDGWEFLAHYHRLNIAAYKQSNIFILTSSASPADKQRSLSNPMVTEFISKPIELKKMKAIFDRTF